MIKRYFLISIVTTFMVLPSNLASAQDFNYKINAMYVYYFTKYIDWPGRAESENITIGVLGDSPLTEQLKIIIAARRADARPVIIKRIDITEVKKCQIVVVSKSQSSAIKQVQADTRNLPILIVAEKQGLIRKGADICIYIDDEDKFKTKFEINKANILARKLKIAGELLAMAETVN